MKSNSNFKMSKELKVLLSGLNGDRKLDYKREMIKAIIAPRIEFKKKRKEEAPEES
jgi:hypothetical protein